MPSSTSQLSIAGSIQPSSDNRVCSFCTAVFSRVDAARRHAKRCAQRHGRPLQIRQRGRRAQACDQCSRVKVHCSRRNNDSCERCVSRKFDCSFRRLTINDTHQQQLHQGLSTSRDSRAEVSFLLNFTDDKQEFVTEKAIGEEPDATLLGPTCLTPLSQPSPYSDLLDEFDPTLLLPLSTGTHLDLDGLYPEEDDSDLNILSLPQSWDTSLSTRLDLLGSDLSAHANGSGRQNVSFNSRVFRNFFSLTNVQTFATTFCRKRHYQYTIIHWPTFAIEEASLPLLIVVVLTGAAYSLHEPNGTEHVLESRKFYEIADSYIFGQLETCSDGVNSTICHADALELCQASLLMYGLESLLGGDSVLRHLSITKRLPTLISTLRTLEYTECRHENTEDWQTFLQREKIVRLVAWTFGADCLATLSCNKPPGFSLLEMTGDLPCNPAVWEVDSDLSFASMEQPKQNHARSIKDLMAGFLDPASLTVGDFENVPIFHLHILLCGELSTVIYILLEIFTNVRSLLAFQQHIYNLHVTMTLAEHSEKLLRRLQTWRHLWNTTIDRLPDKDRKLLGVAKHVCDLEYLTRRIIKVGISPEASSSQYLRRIPSTGVQEIHEFIRDFVTGPG